MDPFAESTDPPLSGTQLAAVFLTGQASSLWRGGPGNRGKDGAGPLGSVPSLIPTNQILSFPPQPHREKVQEGETASVLPVAIPVATRNRN